MSDVSYLHETARKIRIDVLNMVYDVKDGHPGPAYSSTDIITALYFGDILKVDPENPDWEDRDRFVLSKGHACPAFYSALIRRGFMPEDEKLTLRKINSRLQGHPDMAKTPGVDATTGALGNGLGMAVGMAAALKLQGKASRVFVITGDGELQEGICWESIQAAVSLKLDNLYIFVDHNGWQSGGSLDEISGIMPLEEKFRAFRADVSVIDGHDFHQILHAAGGSGVGGAPGSGAPHVIIAKTVKGKGVDFMENNNSWHKGVPTPEEYEDALAQLKPAQQQGGVS
jgi:transketolase